MKEIQRRIEASKAKTHMNEVQEVSMPPPETLDYNFWETLQARCNKKTEDSRYHRLAVLEWLRYESLRIGKPRLTETQRQEYAQELDHIKRGLHHGLLQGEWPLPTLPVHVIKPHSQKRLAPIIELRTARFPIWDETHTSYVDRTLIEPALDDPDPNRPGHLLPTRLVLSIDTQHPDKFLIAALKAKLKKARREVGRTRSPGGGRSKILAQMAEALRLYEPWLQANSPKKVLGYDAKTFGAYDGDVRAQRVEQLATQMILAASASPSVWYQTFR